MQQINIKVGDAITLDGASYHKIKHLGTEEIVVEEIPSFSSNTDKTISCVEIQQSPLFDIIKEENIEYCERCDSLSLNGRYCDVCWGDLHGGQS